MEHTKLPWEVIRDTGIRNNGGYIVFSKDKPFHYPGQDERYEREINEWHGNLEYIVRACNAFPAMEKACKKIMKLRGDLLEGATSMDEGALLANGAEAFDEIEAALAAGGE